MVWQFVREHFCVGIRTTGTGGQQGFKMVGNIDKLPCIQAIHKSSYFFEILITQLLDLPRTICIIVNCF